MKTLKASFNAGELSPMMDARVNVEKYDAGCRKLRNFIIHTHGPVSRRPGMEYLGTQGDDARADYNPALQGSAENDSKAGTPSRFIEFNFSATTRYLIEMTRGVFHFWKDGRQVCITDGDTDAANDPPLEVPHPYKPEEFFAVQVKQVNDVCYLCHPNHHPLKLMRVAEKEWRCTDLPLKYPPLLDEFVEKEITVPGMEEEYFTTGLKEAEELTIEAEASAAMHPVFTLQPLAPEQRVQLCPETLEAMAPWFTLKWAHWGDLPKPLPPTPMPQNYVPPTTAEILTASGKALRLEAQRVDGSWMMIRAQDLPATAGAASRQVQYRFGVSAASLLCEWRTSDTGESWSEEWTSMEVKDFFQGLPSNAKPETAFRLVYESADETPLRSASAATGDASWTLQVLQADCVVHEREMVHIPVQAAGQHPVFLQNSSTDYNVPSEEWFTIEWPWQDFQSVQDAAGKALTLQVRHNQGEWTDVCQVPIPASPVQLEHTQFKFTRGANPQGVRLRHLDCRQRTKAVTATIWPTTWTSVVLGDFFPVINQGDLAPELSFRLFYVTSGPPYEPLQGQLKDLPDVDAGAPATLSVQVQVQGAVVHQQTLEHREPAVLPVNHPVFLDRTRADIGPGVAPWLTVDWTWPDFSKASSEVKTQETARLTNKTLNFQLKLADGTWLNVHALALPKPDSAPVPVQYRFRREGRKLKCDTRQRLAGSTAWSPTWVTLSSTTLAAMDTFFPAEKWKLTDVAPLPGVVTRFVYFAPDAQAEPDLPMRAILVTDRAGNCTRQALERGFAAQVQPLPSFLDGACTEQWSLETDQPWFTLKWSGPSTSSQTLSAGRTLKLQLRQATGRWLTVHTIALTADGTLLNAPGFQYRFRRSGSTTHLACYYRAQEVNGSWPTAWSALDTGALFKEFLPSATTLPARIAFRMVYETPLALSGSDLADRSAQILKGGASGELLQTYALVRHAATTAQQLEAGYTPANWITLSYEGWDETALSSLFVNKQLKLMVSREGASPAEVAALAFPKPGKAWRQQFKLVASGLDLLCFVRVRELDTAWPAWLRTPTKKLTGFFASNTSQLASATPPAVKLRLDYIATHSTAADDPLNLPERSVQLLSGETPQLTTSMPLVAVPEAERPVISSVPCTLPLRIKPAVWFTLKRIGWPATAQAAKEAGKTLSLEVRKPDGTWVVATPVPLAGISTDADLTQYRFRLSGTSLVLERRLTSSTVLPLSTSLDDTGWPLDRVGAALWSTAGNAVTLKNFFTTAPSHLPALTFRLVYGTAMQGKLEGRSLRVLPGGAMSGSPLSEREMKYLPAGGSPTPANNSYIMSREMELEWALPALNPTTGRCIAWSAYGPEGWRQLWEQIITYNTDHGQAKRKTVRLRKPTPTTLAVEKLDPVTSVWSTCGAPVVVPEQDSSWRIRLGYTLGSRAAATNKPAYVNADVLGYGVLRTNGAEVYRRNLEACPSADDEQGTGGHLLDPGKWMATAHVHAWAAHPAFTLPAPVYDPASNDPPPPVEFKIDWLWPDEPPALPAGNAARSFTLQIQTGPRDWLSIRPVDEAAPLLPDLATLNGQTNPSRKPPPLHFRLRRPAKNSPHLLVEQLVPAAGNTAEWTAWSDIVSFYPAATVGMPAATLRLVFGPDAKGNTPRHMALVTSPLANGLLDATTGAEPPVLDGDAPGDRPLCFPLTYRPSSPHIFDHFPEPPAFTCKTNKPGDASVTGNFPTFTLNWTWDGDPPERLARALPRRLSLEIQRGSGHWLELGEIDLFAPSGQSPHERQFRFFYQGNDLRVQHRQRDKYAVILAAWTSIPWQDFTLIKGFFAGTPASTFTSVTCRFIYGPDAAADLPSHKVRVEPALSGASGSLERPLRWYYSEPGLPTAPAGATLTLQRWDFNAGRWVDITVKWNLSRGNSFSYDGTTFGELKERTRVRALYSGGPSGQSAVGSVVFLGVTPSTESTIKISVEETSGQNRKMKASAPLFKPGHKGSYWQIAHRRETTSAQITTKFSGSASSGTLYPTGKTKPQTITYETGSKDSQGRNITATTVELVSPSIRIVGTWDLFTYGSWSGELRLEKETTKDNWEIVRTWSAHNDRNITTSGVTSDDTHYRLVLSGHAADPTLEDPTAPRNRATGRITGTDSVPSSTPRFMIEAADARVYGVVRILEVIAADEARVDVIMPLGSIMETPLWAEGAWSELRGYPAALALHQQRLWFGGTESKPQNVWASVIGDFENFRRSTLDDGSLALTLAAESSNPIHWLSSTLTALLIGTGGEEWALTAGQDGGAITPLNMRITRQSGYSSAHLPAKMTGDVTIFVQRDLRRLRQIGYSNEQAGFAGTDLTILASHITRGGIKQLAFQQAPNPILWVVTHSGKLAAMTFERESNVFGWHLHETDGFIQTIAVLHGTPADEVWLGVDRVINGRLRRNIERMTMTSEITDATRMIYLDSARVWTPPPLPEHPDQPGPAQTQIDGLSHLEGRTVSVLADGVAYEGLRVTAGSLQLPVPARIAIVGLPYTSVLQPMKQELPLQDGTAQGRRFKLNRATVRLYHSGGGQLSANGSDPQLPWAALPAPPVSATDTGNTDPDVRLYSGEADIIPASRHENALNLTLRSSSPHPLTLTSLILNFDVVGG